MANLLQCAVFNGVIPLHWCQAQQDIGLPLVAVRLCKIDSW
jgi:hypothetical protein